MMELTEENLEYITFVSKEYCHLPELETVFITIEQPKLIRNIRV